MFRSLKDGKSITDDTRIREGLYRHLGMRCAIRAKVILCLALGRPKGKPGEEYDEPATHCRPGCVFCWTRSSTSRRNVAFSPDCVGEIAKEMARELESGQTLLLENLRFHKEEEANDPAFAKQLAELCDVYVNDAFGSAHRANARPRALPTMWRNRPRACSWKRA